MDNLDVVRAVYEDRFRDTESFKASFGDDNVSGYGIGFDHWRTRKAKKNQKYAIVMLVDPDISQAALKLLPKKIPVNKKDVPSLANKKSLPKQLMVPVRYERVKPVLLSATAAAHVDGAATAAPAFSTTITAGDPLFSQGVFIGTSGFVFQFQGTPHIASNNHVLANAGIGNAVFNAGGNAIATVSSLNTAADSGLAALHVGVNFSNMLPGIGNPTTFGPAPRMNERARKTGASTQFTEINIIWEGVFNGLATVVGSNVQGSNVPAVGSGDSGSVLVNSNTGITSLVFAGSIEIGSTPAGKLFSNLWAIDIRTAFQGISIP